MYSKHIARTLTITAFLFGALVIAPHSQAQTAESPSSPACTPTTWMCANVTDLDAGIVDTSHRQQMQVSGLPTTNPLTGQPMDIYVACGVDTPDGMLFTTGNSQYDKDLCLGEDTRSLLARNYDYTLTILNSSNPFSTADGSANVTALPSTYGAKNHMCFYVWKNPVDVVDEGGGSRNEASGQINTLTYATFRMQSAPDQCTSIKADPFGRVFNEQLRPVPGATVSLFDFDDGQILKEVGVRNPVTVLEDGVFNFNIQPNTTFLKTDLANNVDIPQNAALAYSNIYTYGDPIVETGENIEQRDIPVIGGNPSVLKLMGYGQIQFGTQTRIEGNASWPLTIVEVLQGEQSLLKESSDKFGGFSFFVNNNTIDPKQQLILRLVEVDLLTAPSVPVIGGQTDEVAFDPIPTYLEGYAYDTNGELVPFATVRVVLKQSDDVYYKTTADAQAFFSIGPRFLPILPFYLEIIPANVIPDSSNTSTVTIPEYAQRNEQYHKDNNIDIIAGTKNGRRVDPEAREVGSEDTINADNPNFDPNDPSNMTPEERMKFEAEQAQMEAENTQTSRRNNVIAVAIIITFAIIAVALGVYIKKKGGLSKSGAETYSKEGETTESDIPEPVE